MKMPPQSARPALLRVSVVVPTFHQPLSLRRCLEALLQQRFDPLAYEIIVVDDGHDDDVRTAVLAMARVVQAPTIRYLRPAHGRGPAVARNVGWESARAPLVAFTDDDTIPDLDWIAEGTDAMTRHPGCAAMAGQVEVPLEAERPPRDHELMTQDLAQAEFITANAFVRRDALRRLGGFDERFERAWREDSNLQFRLLEEVGPVGRCNKALVVHPVRNEPWGVCLRQQRNTYFDALLHKTHPQLYRQRIRPVPPWDYYLVVVLTLLAPSLWLLGANTLGVAALAGAAALVFRFAWQRLRETDHSWRHVAEMLATSVLIPFVSVYWRLRGALRFRVLFL